MCYHCLRADRADNENDDADSAVDHHTGFRRHALRDVEIPRRVSDDATTQKVYDNLDYLRGVEAFLNAFRDASAEAARLGFASVGADNNQTVLIMENLMDSKSVFLTPTTESIYSLMWVDAKDGPAVIEIPSDVPGVVDDHWFHYVGDFGRVGPDRNKGGKLLLLPLGYQGHVPHGYLVLRSSTYGNLVFWRGFLGKNGTQTAGENTKKYTRIYRLADAKKSAPDEIR